MACCVVLGCARIISSLIYVWLVIQCHLVTSVSSSSRVALIFRGKHTTFHHFIEEQRRLLVEPLIKNGIIVDVYLITPNSSRFHEMETQYKSFANGEFESSIEKTDHGLDAQHGEEILVSLRLAATTCNRWQPPTDNQIQLNLCWKSIVVWHFAVAPKISVLDLGIQSGMLMLPWREAHAPLPDTQYTETAKQIRKACSAYQSRYYSDSKGQRSAHIVFWFDGSLFEKMQSLFLSEGGSGSDAPYMFQPMIDHNTVQYALQGFWESSPKNPNPLIEMSHSEDAAVARSRYLLHHCCAEAEASKTSIKGLDTKHNNIALLLGLPPSIVHGYDTCPTFDAPKEEAPTSSESVTTPVTTPSDVIHQLANVVSSVNVFHHVKDHSGHDKPEDMAVSHEMSHDSTIVMNANGEEAVSLITPRHNLELQRLSMIDWNKYQSFTHRGKNIPELEVIFKKYNVL